MPICLGNAPLNQIICAIMDGYEGIFIFEYRSRCRELSVPNLKIVLSR
jgi:hypothetical protein